MRKILIILFSVIFLHGYSATYYMAPSTATPAGNDANAGTLAAPWLTINKARAVMVAGDTTFLRGGVYYQTAVTEIRSKNGTASNPICYFAYPADFAAGNVPILDYNTWMTPNNPAVQQQAFYIYNSSYIYFQGITLRYVRQRYMENIVMGFRGYQSSNLIFTQCVGHNVDGKAWRVYNCDDVSWYNCDAYNCADTLRASPGNGGTGFNFNAATSYSTCTGYFYGCRSWHCSDQGFSGGYNTIMTFDRCWTWGNGYLSGPGLGSGFKFGFESTTTPTRLVINCIAAYNLTYGFNDNSSAYTRTEQTFYNNISYHNSYGFFIGDPPANGEIRTYRNNVAYANTSGAVSTPGGTSSYVHDHNSWDIPLTLSVADFVSVDSIGLTGVRQADGSLPLLNFLHPAAGQDLINAGTDNSAIIIPPLDGDGNVWGNPTPTIGAFELPVIAPTLVTSIDVWGTGYATTIIIEGGTLQMLKKTLPVDATDTTVVWTCIDGTGDGSISSSGLLTANTNGIVTVRATAHDGSGIYGEETITISNQNPDAGLPTVTTQTPYGITTISAIAGGNVTDDGGATVTDRGVCWSLAVNPTTADSHNHEGTGEGLFESTITGLIVNTVYHVRAFAINIEGTAYGSDVIFTTTNDKLIFEGVTIIIGRDGTIIIKR